ncbi:glycerate kinase-like [Sycon ciliatum]|uniref:glycerate kinase-like n=1 Tax=Sycon ciliatum TaxID=27933 RepID=UPI0031F6A2E4
MASSSTTCLRNLARSIFQVGVEAVSPRSAVERAVKRVSNSLLVETDGQQYEFPLQENVKVVGFGKAVHSMALGVVDILGTRESRTSGGLGENIVAPVNHLTHAAVCSVPHGIVRTNNQLLEDRIVLHHGARHNLPDASAASAAWEIRDIAEACDRSDLLIVLISGGGSALLPMPVDGITLEEKRRTTQLLAQAGADITQLNTVRHHLSQFKAGGLARLAQPAQVLSLVLSDVLDDRLDIIAGGPTCNADTTREDCVKICSSLGVLPQLPRAVREFLESTGSSATPEQFPSSRVTNCIIGSNRTAVDAAVTEASRHVQVTFPYYGLIGDADELGCFYGRWMHLASAAYRGCGSSLAELYQWIMSRLDDEDLATAVVEACQQQKSFCFVAGAEPTVNVRGTGLGGRSQQLALRAAVEVTTASSGSHRRQGKAALPPSSPPSSDSRACSDMTALLLAAGTDGIDGPTDACGAMAHSDGIGASMKEAAACLVDNDAYSFFKNHGSGKDLLVTGATGTNVSDLHVLLFQHKHSSEL